MEKNQTITFRASQEDKEAWETAAKKNNMNLTQYLHYSISNALKLQKENDALTYMLRSFYTGFTGYIEIGKECDNGNISDKLRKRSQAAIENVIRVSMEVLIDSELIKQEVISTNKKK